MEFWCDLLLSPHICLSAHKTACFSYSSQNFRHPFIREVDRYRREPDLYHLYTQNNHSGSGGYLNIIEFCKAANVSFAIVTERGVSSFSPLSEVCFPGRPYIP